MKTRAELLRSRAMIEMPFALGQVSTKKNHLLDVAELFQPDTVVWAFHKIQLSGYICIFAVLLSTFTKLSFYTVAEFWRQFFFVFFHVFAVFTKIRLCGGLLLESMK